MKGIEVRRVTDDEIEFMNGIKLTSEHNQNCCETHFLSFSDLTEDDFAGLEFDLSGDSFFKRIPDYGIELIPIHGHSVKVPGYGSNNGCYSSDLTLVLSGLTKTFDITDCQVITD